jgi:phosphinothricin acetyltransferase
MIISMIRPATEGDAQRVAEIYNHYVLSTTVTFEENVVAVATMAQRIAETQRTLPYLVAEDEAQRVTAFAYASPWKSRCAYRGTAKTTVYAAPDCLRQGHGALLYHALRRLARALHSHSPRRDRPLPISPLQGINQACQPASDDLNAGTTKKENQQKP